MGVDGVEVGFEGCRGGGGAIIGGGEFWFAG